MLTSRSSRRPAARPPTLAQVRECTDPAQLAAWLVAVLEPRVPVVTRLLGAARVWSPAIAGAIGDHPSFALAVVSNAHLRSAAEGWLAAWLAARLRAPFERTPSDTSMEISLGVRLARAGALDREPGLAAAALAAAVDDGSWFTTPHVEIGAETVLHWRRMPPFDLARFARRWLGDQHLLARALSHRSASPGLVASLLDAVEQDPAFDRAYEVVRAVAASPLVARRAALRARLALLDDRDPTSRGLGRFHVARAAASAAEVRALLGPAIARDPERLWNALHTLDPVVWSALEAADLAPFLAIPALARDVRMPDVVSRVGGSTPSRRAPPTPSRPMP